MDWILTTASEVLCDVETATPPRHGGTVQLPPTTGAKLTINGAPVLVPSDIAGQAVSGCHTPTSSAPTSPCTAVAGVTSPPSQAGKLTVGGVAVVTEKLKGVPPAGGTDGVPPGSLTADAKQTTLRAD